jgi:BlaI family penicillinase repressor
MRNNKSPNKSLSGLEQLVMDFLWASGPSTSETVRESLMKKHPMKEGTARTILRRLEAKGYVTHTEEGRTYIYSSAVGKENIAVHTVRQIIDKFWGGSTQAFVAGMVEHEIIAPEELRELSRKLERRKKAGN